MGEGLILDEVPESEEKVVLGKALTSERLEETPSDAGKFVTEKVISHFGEVDPQKRITWTRDGDEAYENNPEDEKKDSDEDIDVESSVRNCKLEATERDSTSTSTGASV